MEIMMKLLKALGYISAYPLYLLSKFIPKKDNLCVYGAARGRFFIDNSKYAFLQKEPSIRKIWLTRNKHVVKFLRQRGFEAYHYWSLRGMYYQLRAKKAFISHRIDDINRFLTGGLEVIQLWHGIPLKRIGYGGDWDDINIMGKLRRYLYRLLPFTYYLMCDKVCVPSQFLVPIFKEAFKYSFRKGEKVFISPYPRWKAIRSKERFLENTPLVRRLELFKKKGYKVVSWMPTHRAQLGKNLLNVIKETRFNFSKLEKYCADRKILFLIKPHFMDYDSVVQFLSQMDLTNVILTNEMDPYPILRYVDILVTDYSSIYFDFLLLNRPIIFFPHDYDEYKKKVKFYYDYNKVTPGPKVASFEEMLHRLDELLSTDYDSYESFRRQIRRKFLGF
jgi:CDP-glycerol glycerophosphotransferase (TagB/SpsB family)